MGTELKPCPFCGENKHEYYVEEEPMGLRIRGEAFKQKLDFECWVVECLTCDTSGPGDISERLAIKKWNKRAETTKLEARVRELEAMILELNEMCDYSSKYSEVDIIFKISDMAKGLNPPESGEK